MVVFPGMIAPIFVGRAKSIQALLNTKVLNNDRYILLVLQKQQNKESHNIQDLHQVGVLAKIIQTVRIQNNAKILVEAISKVTLHDIISNDMFEAEYEIIQIKR